MNFIDISDEIIYYDASRRALIRAEGFKSTKCRLISATLPDADFAIHSNLHINARRPERH